MSLKENVLKCIIKEIILILRKALAQNQELKNRGYKVNHKRVQRLMHEAGLAGKRPKEKYHSYKVEVGKIADNIINRDFSTTAHLQKWTTDVS